MKGKFRVKRARSRLNLLQRNLVASLHWGSHRLELGLERHLLDFIIEPSPDGAIIVQDQIVPGYVHRHAFSDRALCRLRGAGFDPQTGGAFLGTTFLRESLSNIAGVPVVRARSRCREIKGPLIGVPAQTHFHWLLEVLPRIIAAKAYEPSATLVAPTNLSNAQREALATVSDEIHYCDSLHPADELVLATFGYDSGWPHPNDLRLLRSHFQVPERQGSEAIYVSRVGAARSDQGSKMAQDFAIEAGWTVIRGEDLSWSQHLDVFGDARLVAGEHGAGLANIALSPFETQSIELYRLDYSNPCFSSLSLALGKERSAHRSYPLTKFRTVLDCL